VRRAPLIRYPYVVYYEATEGQVVILRVLHGMRRRPWPD
jgi:plasmid stabilization system protein ParE